MSYFMLEYKNKLLRSVAKIMRSISNRFAPIFFLLYLSSKKANAIYKFIQMPL